VGCLLVPQLGDDSCKNPVAAQDAALDHFCRQVAMLRQQAEFVLVRSGDGKYFTRG
jgi:hypothetical protein